jgi:CBS domain-containing protein
MTTLGDGTMIRVAAAAGADDGGGDALLAAPVVTSLCGFPCCCNRRYERRVITPSDVLDSSIPLARRRHAIVAYFTDGDLRRLVEKGGDLRSLRAADVMHPSPHTIRSGLLAVEAAEAMERHRITSILVVDGAGRLCGALNTNDLMRAKVI